MGQHRKAKPRRGIIATHAHTHARKHTQTHAQYACGVQAAAWMALGSIYPTTTWYYYYRTDDIQRATTEHSTTSITCYYHCYCYYYYCCCCLLLLPCTSSGTYQVSIHPPPTATGCAEKRTCQRLVGWPFVRMPDKKMRRHCALMICKCYHTRQVCAKTDPRLIPCPQERDGELAVNGAAVPGISRFSVCADDTFLSIRVLEVGGTSQLFYLTATVGLTETQRGRRHWHQQLDLSF